MYTALIASSKTLMYLLRQEFLNDPFLAESFNPAQGGTMDVFLNTPEDMCSLRQQGLSIWLYRINRDEHVLNAPPQRVDLNRIRRTPLPIRLHYLITPIVEGALYSGPELEQTILGKVLQVLYDHPKQRGSDLQGSDFEGTDIELHTRLEPLSLEEITRVWDALESSYQLSVSYEVSVIEIESAQQPQDIVPVREVVPGYGVIVRSE